MNQEARRALRQAVEGRQYDLDRAESRAQSLRHELTRVLWEYNVEVRKIERLHAEIIACAEVAGDLDGSQIADIRSAP